MLTVCLLFLLAALITFGVVKLLKSDWFSWDFNYTVGVFSVAICLVAWFVVYLAYLDIQTEDLEDLLVSGNEPKAKVEQTITVENSKPSNSSTVSSSSVKSPNRESKEKVEQVTTITKTTSTSGSTTKVRSSSVERPDHESNANNNKFWFRKCAYTSLDNEGNPINSTMQYQHPQQGNMFEVEVVYHDNNSHPVDIYLNEIDANSKIVKSDLLVPLLTKHVTAVEYKDDGLNLYTAKYQVHFSGDGSRIIVWSLNNGLYSNGSAKIYNAGDAAPVYEVRYRVLRDNLKKYFK